MKTLICVVRGWLYMFAFVTGGNFVRLARLRRLGKNVKISPSVFFKHPEQIEIGDNTFINHLCCIWAAPAGPIRIGNDVLFGPNVSIISSNHGTSLSTLIRLQPGKDEPITIGNDVWIGANVVVTAGVVIGDGCIVGAGSVVTRSLPSYSLCVGVPARPIRPRGVESDLIALGTKDTSQSDELLSRGKKLQ